MLSNRVRFLFFILSFVLFFTSCSSTPKGSYSRSHIDRPYAMPDDVASIELGASAYQSSVKDVTGVSSLVADTTQFYGLPILKFEHGISSNLSWIYPLGLRWGVFDKNEHNLGFSFFSLLLYNEYSLDYWYRFNHKISLRPYFKSEQTNILFYEQRTDIYGANILYQKTENLALSFGVGVGTFFGRSQFFETIIDEILQSQSSLDSSVSGDVLRLSVQIIYSLSDRWDFRSEIFSETIAMPLFNVSTQRLSTSFVYFY